MSQIGKNNKNYNLIIGRHCLFKKPDYLLGAVTEGVSYGANALMIYLGAPQNTSRRPLTVLKITDFKNALVENNINIDNVIIHGPYVVNMANPARPEIFRWSVEFLQKEVTRLEKIGFKTLILHPGSAVEAPIDQSLSQVAAGINLILEKSSQVRIVLETMCGRGSEIGINFQQLKFIIDRVKQQKRIGICWDTCHLYSAGYDIKNNLEAVIKEFDQVIGLDKLWVIHINDSTQELGSKVDRHENIGQGKIGFKALQKIVWHPKFNGIPKLLETPRKRKDFTEEIRELKKNI
ncbi:MAG: deoxyribonuclease IV [Candidatus Moeniiplasma glomeromycotorum]|nr:deoxyribonuclease IV [Candidatus Moeniiplasma glomeromycotorum]MCE8169846.1 deoxyribonuclease IV [Candidatus Moeniiplasma glomeromycotorum]